MLQINYSTKLLWKDWTVLRLPIFLRIIKCEVVLIRWQIHPHTPMERIQCVQPSADLTIPSTQTIQTTKSDFPCHQLQQTNHRLQWARKQQNPFLCFLFLIFFRVFLYLTEEVKSEKIAQRVPFYAYTQISYFWHFMLIMVHLS